MNTIAVNPDNFNLPDFLKCHNPGNRTSKDVIDGGKYRGCLVGELVRNFEFYSDIEGKWKAVNAQSGITIHRRLDLTIRVAANTYIPTIKQEEKKESKHYEIFRAMVNFRSLEVPSEVMTQLNDKCEAGKLLQVPHQHHEGHHHCLRCIAETFSEAYFVATALISV